MKISLICILLLALLTGFLVLRPAPQDNFRLTDITGHMPDLQFSLTDDIGRIATGQQYRGQIVLLYFGFTECPDQCPATLSRLTGILRKLGKDADNVQVLFVSVDPAHDTLQVLHAYLQAFDAKHMTGLTGKESELLALTKRYRVAYQPASAGNALVHGNALYIFDAQGRARLLASSDDADAAIADDLTRLVHDRR